MGKMCMYISLLVMMVVVIGVEKVRALEVKGGLGVGVPPPGRVKVTGDDLLTPEWLQNIPTQSKIAKYRKRRFVNFPTGSRLDVEIVLTVPTEGLADKGTMQVENDLSFNLPNSSYHHYDYHGHGRSLVPTTQRMDFYGRAEAFLSGLGYDGHACTLRAICEVAELPFQHGLFGELVNLVLSVSGSSHNEVDGEEEPDDEYARAEHYGKHRGKCQDLYSTCPFSVLNFVSHILPV